MFIIGLLLNFEISATQLLITIFTATITILGIIIQRKTEKIKIIENQISQNKMKAYYELFDIFFGIIRDMKLKKYKENDNKLLEKLLNSKKDFFIYGSDKVINKYTDWLVFTNSPESTNSAKSMDLLFELFIEMRRDMGYKNTKLTKHDLLLLIMQNREEVKSFFNS